VCVCLCLCVCVCVCVCVCDGVKKDRLFLLKRHNSGVSHLMTSKCVQAVSKSCWNSCHADKSDCATLLYRKPDEGSNF